MSGNTVTVVQKRSVARVEVRREQVEVERNNAVTVLDRDTRTVELTTAGPQGPQGEPGLSGGGTIPPIPFSYGDASPATIYTPSSAGTFTAVRVIFDTAFNGTGASIALGTVASPEILLATNENDPASADSEYEVTPDVHVAAGTAIRLSITPGAGASAGAGRVLLTFIPD